MPEKILFHGNLLPTMIDALSQRFEGLSCRTGAEFDAIVRDHGSEIVGVATMGPVDGNRLDAAFFNKFENLRIVSSFGVGYDNIDAVAAAERNIMVTNTPDVLTDEVADTAMGLLLMTARELSASERWLRDGNWTGKGPYPLTDITLRNRTMGILGLGRIGKAIAKRAEAFGLKIAYHNRNKLDDVAYPYYDSVTALAEAVDTLMIVTPGGASTHHLVDAGVMKALGSNGIIINIGRGSTIDEQALITALEDGTIRSVGLDVFEKEPQVPHELIDMETIVLLPHVGSASVHTRNGMGQLVVDNLISWFDTGKAVTAVPETAGVEAG